MRKLDGFKNRFQFLLSIQWQFHHISQPPGGGSCFDLRLSKHSRLRNTNHHHSLGEFVMPPLGRR